jgi:uncharacterized protein YkwD
MLTRHLRVLLIAAASVATILGLATPAGVAATASNQHHSGEVRSYDAHLLAHSNSARTADHTHSYTMNRRLWKVAHAWAEHLAHTGVLEHNPALEHQISNRCPRWTAIGENVGVVYGKSVRELFRAYMQSPEHRANILDRRYHQVGIATVKVTRHGQVQEWDVMDFGNHC